MTNSPRDKKKGKTKAFISIRGKQFQCFSFKCSFVVREYREKTLDLTGHYLDNSEDVRFHG